MNDFKNEFLHNPPVPESLQLFNVWNFQNRDTQYGLDFKGAIPFYRTISLKNTHAQELTNTLEVSSILAEACSPSLVFEVEIP
jgi:hypothetical protein